MEKFEYKILDISTAKIRRESFQADIMETLNKLGEQSWELVNVEGLNRAFLRASETVDLLFILKRRKL